jgi:hypothetical protein
MKDGGQTSLVWHDQAFSYGSLLDTMAFEASIEYLQLKPGQFVTLETIPQRPLRCCWRL